MAFFHEIALWLCLFRRLDGSLYLGEIVRLYGGD